MALLRLPFNMDDERVPAKVGREVRENGPHALNGSSDLDLRVDFVHWTILTMTQYAPIEWRLAVSPACRVAPPGTVLTVWKWPATAEYCVGNIDPAVAARLQEGLQAAKASSTCNARLSHRAHCPDRIWYQGESRRIPARSIVSRTSVNLTCTLDKRSLYRGGNRFRSLQCRKPQYSPLPAEEVHPRRANLLHPIPRAIRRASAHRSRSVRRRPIKEL